VTVAALGLGVMSVAPSNAAAQLDSLAVSLASTTQNTTETLTSTASVLTATLAGTKGIDTLTVTASIVSGPAYVQPVLAFKESTTAIASTSADSSVQTVTPNDTNTVSQATAKYNVYLKAPTVVGTYVVKIAPTGGTNAAAVTVSIVVSAITIQAPSATNSKVFLGVSATSGITDRGAWVQGAEGSRYSGLFEGYGGGLVSNNQADTRTISLPLAGTLIGGGAWQLYGANTAVPAQRTPVTYTVSGPASLSLQTDATSLYSTFYTNTSVTESKLGTVGHDPYDPASQNGSFWLTSTGAGGVVKVTLTMGGVTLGSRSFSVIGVPTAYVFGTPTKTVTGVGETSSVTVTGTDSILTTTGAASVYAFSSDTSVATVNSTQASTVVITGVKSGTATITVGNAATIATSTITKTLAIKVGAITAKTVAFTMSPTAPQPGEKVTLTVTATDASGNAVGDGSRNLFSSTGITTSLAVQGATWTASTAAVTLVGGIATYTFYAPTGTGLLTVSATEGASTDNVIAAGTAAAITSSVTITNAGTDAATSAAEAAEAAAQDATDAALDATTAAEAAGALAQEAVDLVTELSAEVTKLMTALKAQIDSLTKLVLKMAITVAKVAAKK